MPASHRLWTYSRERRALTHLAPAALVAGVTAAWLGGDMGGQPPGAITLAIIAVSVMCLALLRRVVGDAAGYHGEVANHPSSSLGRGLVSRPYLLCLAAVLALVPVVAHIAGAGALLVPFALAAVAVAVTAAVAVAVAGEVDRPRVGLSAVVRSLGYLAIGAYAAAPGWVGASPNTGVMAVVAYAFVAGLAWEIGRDLRGPTEVAPGEAVVSAAWGSLAAIIVWFVLMMVAGSLMAAVALYQPTAWAVALAIDVTLLVAAIVGIVYARLPSARRGALVARYTAGWALGVPMVLALRTAAL